MQSKGLRWSPIAGAENGWPMRYTQIRCLWRPQGLRSTLRLSSLYHILPDVFMGKRHRIGTFEGSATRMGVCVREKGCHWGSSITSLPWARVSRWAWSSSTGHTGCPSRELITRLQKHSVEALTFFLSKEGYFLVTLYVLPWNQKSLLLTSA